jgi:phage terminase small subunit
MTYKDVWHVPPVLPNKMQERTNRKVAPLKKQRKRLTQKEWTFVQELVGGDGAVTMKEAALRAGYTPQSAKTVAWKLTNPDLNPHVCAAIQEYRAELAAKYGITYERHMKDLQTIRDAALAAGAYGAAVQAEYRRGQALGTIYVERKEIRHGTIDSMSREEVERKLNEIKSLYGGPPPQAILDVEARDVTIEKDPPFEARKALEAFPDLEDIDVNDKAGSGPVQTPEGKPTE